MEVSLDTSQSPDKVSLDTGTPELKLPDTVVASRAAKAGHALGPILGTDYKDLYSQFVNGEEGTFRQSAAADVDWDKAKQRQQDIVQMAANPITSNADLMRSLIKQEPSNPDTIIESSYAQKFLHGLSDTTDPWTNKTHVKWAMNSIPDEAKALADNGNNIGAWNELARTQAENYDALSQHQSWDDYTRQTIQENFPLYGMASAELALRSDRPPGDWKALLGDELEQERLNLLNQPFNEGAPKFLARLKSLYDFDPGLATLYAHSVYGLSDDEIKTTNEYQAISYLPLGAALMHGLGRLVKPITKGAPTFNVSGTLAGTVKKAVDDALVAQKETSIAPVPPEEAVDVGSNVATGNQQEAAISKFKFDIYRDAQGQSTVEEKMIRPLSSYFRFMSKEWASDPGNAGQDFTNRMNERREQLGVDTSNMFQNLLRQVRRPAINVMDTIARYIKDDTIGRFPGPNNSILDVSDNFIIDPKTNTLHLKIASGTNNGDFFYSRGHAEGVAEIQKHPMSSPSYPEIYDWNNKITELNFKMLDLQQQLKEPVDMHADVNELNRRDKLETDLKATIKEHSLATRKRADLQVIPVDKPEISGAVPIQHAMGWYLEHTIPVNINDHTLLNSLIYPSDYTERTGTQYYGLDRDGKPNSKLSEMQGWVWNNGSWNVNLFRMPKETLSPEEGAAREVLTHGPGVIMNKLIEYDKAINNLSPKEHERVLRVLTDNQTMPDRTGKSEQPGYYFRNHGELDEHYQQFFGMLPSQKEYSAYAAHVDMMEMDRVFRDIADQRNKWDNGAMNYEIGGAEGKYSNRFVGVKRDSLPRLKRSALIAIDGKFEVRSLDRLGQARYDKLDGMIQRGEASVIQIYSPDEKPLHSVSRAIKPNHRLIYVITDNMKASNLVDGQQIPRQLGGHNVYDYRNSVGYPDVNYDPATGSYDYLGDQTHALVKDPVTGKKLEEHLNNLLRFKQEGVPDEILREIHNDAGFGGFDYDRDFADHFKPRTGEDGQTLPPRFNYSPGARFRLKPLGINIIDMDKELENAHISAGTTLTDGTREGNIAKANMVEFSGSRDAYNLMALEAKGSVFDPVYDFRPAQMMDPMTTIRRGLSRITNSLFMDEYKDAAVKHWLASSMNLFDKSMPSDRVWANPYGAFLEPDWNKAAKTDGTPENIGRNILLAQKKKIQDFISTPHAYEASLNTFLAHVFGEGVEESNLYKQLTNEMLPASPYDAAILNPDKIAPLIQTPVRGLKNLAVWTKLFYSPAAMFTQAMATMNAIMMEPEFGMKGMTGALLHIMDRVFPNHEAFWEKIATRNGDFLPSHWTEINKFLKESTNFQHLGQEHSELANFNPNYVNSVGSFAKYTGGILFKTGAELVRLVAMYTAYGKFKAANPLSIPTQMELGRIINYAADLDHNMARSGMSVLNTGIMSVPSTFMTYGMRMPELILGKRVTPAQRVRLIAGSALLWGPLGVGASMVAPVFGAIQLKNWITEKLINNANYIPGNNPLMDFGVNGGLSVALKYALGGGDYKKGTLFDLSKYGSWEGLARFMDTDTSTLGHVMGAPGSIISQVWANSMGKDSVRRALYDIITGTENPDDPKLTVEDLTRLLNVQAGIGYSTRFANALKTGKWISNNGSMLESVNWQGALFRALTGVNSVRTDQLQANRNIVKSREERVKDIQKQYSEEYQRYLISIIQGNENKQFKRNAQWLLNGTGDLNADDRKRIATEETKRHGDLYDQAMQQQTTQHVPPSQMIGKIHQQETYEQMKRDEQ